MTNGSSNLCWAPQKNSGVQVLEKKFWFLFRNINWQPLPKNDIVASDVASISCLFLTNTDFYHLNVLFYPVLYFRFILFYLLCILIPYIWRKVFRMVEPRDIGQVGHQRGEHHIVQMEPGHLLGMGQNCRNCGRSGQVHTAQGERGPAIAGVLLLRNVPRKKKNKFLSEFLRIKQ